MNKQTTSTEIKKLLKKQFPETKFSVTQKYERIRVTWENGRNFDEVQKLCNPFETYKMEMEPSGDFIHYGGVSIYYDRQINGEIIETEAQKILASVNYKDEIYFSPYKTFQSRITGERYENLDKRLWAAINSTNY